MKRSTWALIGVGWLAVNLSGAFFHGPQWWVPAGAILWMLSVVLGTGVLMSIGVDAMEEEDNP